MSISGAEREQSDKRLDIFSEKQQDDCIELFFSAGRGRRSESSLEVCDPSGSSGQHLVPVCSCVFKTKSFYGGI